MERGGCKLAASTSGRLLSCTTHLHISAAASERQTRPPLLCALPQATVSHTCLAAKRTPSLVTLISTVSPMLPRSLTIRCGRARTEGWEDRGGTEVQGEKTKHLRTRGLLQSAA